MFTVLYNREKGAAMVSKLGKNSEFAEVNIDDKVTLEAALKGILGSSAIFQVWKFSTT